MDLDPGSVDIICYLCVVGGQEHPDVRLATCLSQDRGELYASSAMLPVMITALFACTCISSLIASMYNTLGSNLLTTASCPDNVIWVCYAACTMLSCCAMSCMMLYVSL